MTIILNIENNTNFQYNQNIIEKIIEKFLSDKSIYDNCCLKEAVYKDLSIDFVFCNDEFIHKINKEYRGFDKPTDVISFALFADDNNKIDTEEINLGEIIVSLDTAKRQALEANHSVEKEIYYLISHGILHLLGFDHLTEEEYNFMVEKQNLVTKDIK